MSPTLPSPTAAPALVTTAERRTLAPGTLMLWRHVPRCTESASGMVGLEPPTFVFYPFQAEQQSGLIDLHVFRFAYQAGAVAFTPGAGYSSVTLAETVDRNGPAYTLETTGLVDLYSVGWAARAGAITFNP
jgi:hypothetical protein